MLNGTRTKCEASGIPPPKPQKDVSDTVSHGAKTMHYSLTESEGSGPVTAGCVHIFHLIFVQLNESCY
jgi:hypothetical protein